MQLSVVYGREIDGELTTFGTTGYTYKNTFLLYDRATESMWYPLKKGEFSQTRVIQRSSRFPRAESSASA